jgi:hypothetical protein
MKVITCEIADDEAFIVPIGDIHRGDKGFTKESWKKLNEIILWVKEKPNARVFLNGDLLNTATRQSKTAPTDQNEDLATQKDWVVNTFSEIKHKILGAVSGNHEQRIEDFCGDNPMRDVCYRLDIPYCGYSAVINFKVGWREALKKNNIQYTIFSHHTTGGGHTIGSKMNRVEKLRLLCHNADIIFGSHNHMLGAVPVISPEFNAYANKMVNRTQLLVDCGGYLMWDNSYAERKALEPVKLGSPIIRLDGKIKEMKILF